MKYRLILAAITVSSAMAVNSASAATFSITTGTTTSGQTLGTGSGQTGSISSGATLSVSGSTNAVTISGNNATLTNLGTLKQTGTGRAIRDNTGVTGLTITNGSITNSTALMQSADADVIQMNVAGGSLILNNYGTMTSLNASAGGAQAVDFAAITAAGSNTINNFSTGIMQASEADAVRPGVNGVVNNAGTMKATSSTGSSSDGVDVQANTGIAITNASNWSAGSPLTPGTGLIEGARHGVTGGPASNIAFTTSVTNNLGGTIQGDNGSGINLDGFSGLQTAAITNKGTITGNGVTGDGDGVDVDGLVTLTNTGIVRSINSFNLPAAGVATSEGITVGGGTITNSGTIEGLVASGNTNAVGRGITLAGNDITSGPLAGTREAIYGNATITNQSGGLIRGDSDSGIAVDGAANLSGYTVTINNNAGATIRGGATLAGLGGTNAAIRTGADNDAINNAGTIDGSSNGKAIATGAGNDTLNIVGGAASITGNIDGGSGTNTLNLTLGAGNTFSYGWTITNFNTNVQSGTFNYTGTSALGGNITVDGGVFKNNGGDLTGSLTLTSGTVSGTNLSGVGLTIGNDITLSPGNSPGTLSSGSQIWAGGGSYLWEINRLLADGGSQGGNPGWDFANITGSLTITADSGNPFTIDIDSLGLLTSWDNHQSYTFNLATASGGIVGFDSSDFVLLSTAFADQHSLGDGFFSIGQSGNSVQLTFNAPEPSRGLLLLLGAASFVVRRRRRQ